MLRPRIFLSAVSQELRTARQAVAATLTTLGYDSVSQESFSTGDGELKDWLRRQIDSCEGVLQLVGKGYGAEPPEPDPEFGRVSYTQYEFLYAKQHGKKTWIIVAGDQCQRDTPVERLDLPREPDHPNPNAYQDQRRKLQEGYIAGLKNGNHLRYSANNPTELELLVRRMNDEMKELWQQSKSHQRRLIGSLVAIFMVLVLVCLAGWWGFERINSKAEQTQIEIRKTQDEVKKISVEDKVKMRAHLLETINQTHERELAEAEKERDWKKRQEFSVAADAAYKNRLEKIDELVRSFEEIQGRGNTTTVFQKMTRILAEQGVDETIEYVASQQADILRRVELQATATQEKKRKELEPLLQLAYLHRGKGNNAEARKLYEKITQLEPDWQLPQYQYFFFLVDQGEEAKIRKTLDEALTEYKAAIKLVKPQAENPRNIEWQHNLGILYNNVAAIARDQGNLEEARKAYEESLAIAKRLTVNDQTNFEWQLDMSTSYDHLGDIASSQGKLAEAEKAYEESLAIRKRLFEQDKINTEWLEGLSRSHTNLGRIAKMRGKLAEAEKAYKESLTIAKILVEYDKTNTNSQQFLSAVYDIFGDITRDQGKLAEAEKAYKESLTIRRHLVEQNKTNSKLQRDLSISYKKLGEIAHYQIKLEEAQQAYEKSLTIAKGLVEHDKTNTDLQQVLSDAYDRFGNITRDRGKLNEAKEAYEASLSIRKRLAVQDKTNTKWQQDLSQSYDNIGGIASDQGKLDEAQQAYEEGLAICKRLVEQDKTNVIFQRFLSISYDNLGSIAYEQGKLDEAQQAYEASLLIAKHLTAIDKTNTIWLEDLSSTYERLASIAREQGKFDEVLKAYEASLMIRKRIAESDNTNTEWQLNLYLTYTNFGFAAQIEGKLDEAQKAFEASLAIRKRLAESDKTNTKWQRELAIAYYVLALFMEKQNKPIETKKLFKQALNVMEKLDERGVDISPKDRERMKELREKIGEQDSEKQAVSNEK